MIFITDYQRGFVDGYLAASQGIPLSNIGVGLRGPIPVVDEIQMQPDFVQPKKKRKVSAYNRKYKAAFKKVAPRYKLKSGKWKAGGFKRAVKEAHKIAGRGK